MSQWYDGVARESWEEVVVAAAGGESGRGRGRGRGRSEMLDAMVE